METGKYVKGTSIFLHYPDVEHKVVPAGRVLYHAASTEWDYPDLDGRFVFFEKWSDREFEFQGKTIHVIDERDILGVYEEGEEEFRALSPEEIQVARAYGEQNATDTEAVS